MNIYEKLMMIQNELKAPKNQRNNFGNYNYRSAEDILEAVKPLNQKYKCVLILSDSIVVKENRFYIEAVATLVDAEEENAVIFARAYAREEEVKKGMDSSQVTGSCSSYARKYALNGLYNIDDNKDADTDEQTAIVQEAKKKEAKTKAEEAKKADPVISSDKLEILIKTIAGKQTTVGAVEKRYGKALANLTESEYADCLKGLGKTPDKVAE